MTMSQQRPNVHLMGNQAVQIIDWGPSFSDSEEEITQQHKYSTIMLTGVLIVVPRPFLEQLGLGS